MAEQASNPVASTKPAEPKKPSKIEAMDTTKDGVKAYLDKVAEAQGIAWHSQECHKAAVLLFIMDMLKVHDQETRNQALSVWMKSVPSAFGANASAMSQQLGRETRKEKTNRLYAGM